MTILAFDFGEARIGVAIKAVENPPETLMTIENDQDLTENLDQLISKYDPELLVVGRPRNLEGEPTRQTKKAEEFAEFLTANYNKEITYQDEALTSEEAETRIPTSVTAKARKQIRDQYAALIILEDYLREASLQS